MKLCHGFESLEPLETRLPQATAYLASACVLVIAASRARAGVDEHGWAYAVPEERRAIADIGVLAYARLRSEGTP